MKTYHRSDLATQVDKMRADIERCGESIIGCPELELLCPETSAADEKYGIDQIAEWEQWVFERLRDGSMRFIPLSVDILSRLCRNPHSRTAESKDLLATGSNAIHKRAQTGIPE
jgi:hypothetical protein